MRVFKLSGFFYSILWRGHQLRGLQSKYQECSRKDTLPARHSIQIPCDATSKGVLTSNAARAEPAKGVAATFSDFAVLGDKYAVLTGV